VIGSVLALVCLCTVAVFIYNRRSLRLARAAAGSNGEGGYTVISNPAPPSFAKTYQQEIPQQQYQQAPAPLQEQYQQYQQAPAPPQQQYQQYQQAPIPPQQQYQQQQPVYQQAGAPYQPYASAPSAPPAYRY
jgi:hypothetical protein